MTTTSSSAVILGDAGVVYDLVTHVLRGGGVHVVSEEDAPGTDGCVAVLVNPGANEWEFVRRIGARAVLVTNQPLTETLIVDAVLRGADAVLHGDIAPGEVLEAVNVVGAGESVLTPAQARVLTDSLRASHSGARGGGARLTRREAEILASVNRGESVKQTARALGISVKTVENLQTRLFRRLGVRNRAQAVAVAHSRRLLGHDGEPVAVR